MPPQLTKAVLRKERKRKKNAAYREIIRLNKRDPKELCSLKKHSDQDSFEQLKLISPHSYHSLRVPGKFEEKKHHQKNVPKLKLKMCGTKALLACAEKDRIPLFVHDIHRLLMFALLGQRSYLCTSRWCNLEKRNCLTHIVLIVAENLCINDFTKHFSKFQHKTFEHQLEVVTPLSYNGNLIQELLGVPVSEQQENNHIQQSWSLETAGAVTDLASSFCALQTNFKTSRLPESDTFSRTLLLLSVNQLLENNYPLPVEDLLKERYGVYKFTKDSYQEVTSSSPMYALDCEMCQTTAGLEVTRICLVDENFRVLYKTFVKPCNKITDYLTQYSGVTEEHLANINVCLEDVQNCIRNILPEDAILVGQSLNFDLHALQLMHPFIIDTSVIYNISGKKWYKSKLAVLSQTFLNEEIQKDTGHDPEEDSITALKLVQLKLQRGLEFGDVILAGRKTVDKSLKLDDKKSIPLTYLIESEKTAAFVGDEETIEEYRQCLSKAARERDYKKIECFVETFNESVIRRTCEHTLENDLSLAHIKCPTTINEETCVQINKFFCDVWERVSVNGIFIVLLGGKESSNGLALMEIKS